MCGFAFTFDDTEQFGVDDQVSDDIIRLAAMVSLRKEIKATIHHFHGDCCKRLIERFGDTVGEIHQNRIEQPGCPSLNLDGILSATSKISETQQTLDDGIRIFNAPALPIQGNQISGRQTLGIQLIVQITIPCAAIQHFDQTH